MVLKMGPDQSAALPAPMNDPRPIFRVGYYPWGGPAGADADRKEVLDRLAEANGIRFEQIQYRFREEALFAMKSNEVQYLYDPKRIQKEGHSHLWLGFMCLLGILALVFGLLLLQIGFAEARGYSIDAEERIMAVVGGVWLLYLTLFFGRGALNEYKLLHGDREAIMKDPSVMRRSRRSPILQQQSDVGSEDRDASFSE